MTYVEITLLMVFLVSVMSNIYDHRDTICRDYQDFLHDVRFTIEKYIFKVRNTYRRFNTA